MSTSPVLLEYISEMSICNGRYVDTTMKKQCTSLIQREFQQSKWWYIQTCETFSQQEFFPSMKTALPRLFSGGEAPCRWQGGYTSAQSKRKK